MQSAATCVSPTVAEDAEKQPGEQDPGIETAVGDETELPRESWGAGGGAGPPWEVAMRAALFTSGADGGAARTRGRPCRDFVTRRPASKDRARLPTKPTRKHKHSRH